jgi:tetratricopeptide (TPR) repeat protein
LGNARALDEAEAVFSSISRCLEKAEARPSDQLAVHLKRYIWKWEAGFYSEAVDALKEGEAFAEARDLTAERVRLLDERGYCFQRLNQVKESVALHKRAVKLARKHGLPAQLRISLNNLAEALRKLGRTNEALATYTEAENLSRSAKDFEGALAVAVNRGLAIQETGDLSKAAALLRRCSGEAKRRRCWREYARGLESLGGIEWRRNRLEAAAERYKNALVVAKQHGYGDLETEIAVNYASLLKQIGSTKKALALLRPYENHFGQHEQAYISHDVIAEIYLDEGDTDSARRHWELAKESAGSAGDTHFALIASSSLANLLERQGQLVLAEKELEEALQKEKDPEGRAQLLVQLLRVQLASEVEEKCQSTFDEAQEIAERLSLNDIMMHIHMLVADNGWDKGDRESRVSALQGYLIGVLFSLFLQENGEAARAQAHLVLRLTSGGRAPLADEFDSMLKEAQRILPASVTSKKNLMNRILFPFDVVRQVLPFVGKPRFSKELQRALSSHGV